MSNPADNIIPFPGQPLCGSLVLRIELILMPYPIWRRVCIGDQSSFWDLHSAIQDVMGWSHRHRHLFTVDHPHSGERLRIGIPEPATYHGRQAVLPSWEVRVVDVARVDHPPFLYTYDLGEEWQHEVTLERVRGPDSGEPVPSCPEGEGTCPPEGCGGPAAFARLLGPDGPGLPGGWTPDGFRPEDARFNDPARLWREHFDVE
ncbi:MAG TPA: plasmid pRiA4b ORF-3 family protein [Candidatus Krumholzibacteria bacterium]|nr:plasmid pRiA4b ORF-3 family protein [Candidatus Krumholzibacteria bacterium]HPD71672.1 plasmid pRiA4b ORF-3 family protein [Candidatus Krumholzibacteria bacterium]HRY41395.1 plasmid pRiA4b ORF-3 family protein [Candidatus Krumholzibacteria bacterium]